MSNLHAMPVIEDLVTKELDAAMAAHKENPYTHIVVLAVRSDGAKRTNSLWYAPSKKVSELVGMIECAKLDIYAQAQES